MRIRSNCIAVAVALGIVLPAFAAEKNQPVAHGVRADDV